jgi:hypothetical protein|tara:strand:+ start:588 stop:794 length:207 start_codon:yes stop_codon:yes gene_type:complete
MGRAFTLVESGAAAAARELMQLALAFGDEGLPLAEAGVALLQRTMQYAKLRVRVTLLCRPDAPLLLET